MAGLKLGTLHYDIGADTSKLRRASKEVNRTNKALSRSFKALGATILAAFSIHMARKILTIADNTKLLDQRVRNLTKDNKEFIKTQQELLRISNKVGAAIEDNVKLFESLTIAGKEVGATNDQILTMVENLSELGVIGSASGEAMRNSMRQFGQAMAGGIVRAEEFNSIVENTPFIAKAIADGLGVSIGQLRKMTIEGKLLSKDVFNSILGQTEDIDKQFAKMPNTIERSTQTFQNNLARVIGDMDQLAGSTDFISDLILQAADFVDEHLLEALFGTLNTAQLITDQFNTMPTEINKATGKVEDQKTVWDGIWKGIKQGIKNFVPKWRIAFVGVGVLIDKFSNGLQKVWGRLKVAGAAIANSVGASFDIDKMESDRIKAEKVLDDLSKVRDEAAGKEVAGILKVSKAASKAAKKRDAEFDAGQLKRKKAREEAEANRKKKKGTPDELTGGPEVTSDVSELQKLQAKLGDEFQAIENQYLEHMKAISEIVGIGAAERTELEMAAERNKNLQILELQKSREIMALNAASAFNNQFLDLLAAGGKEQTALFKALFFANKAIQVATIIAETQVGAAKALALGPAGIPLAGIIQATGYASAALVAGLALGNLVTGNTGGGRQAGGPVFSGMMHPVNENGQPELLIQGARQYLLTGNKSGTVKPLDQANGASGVPNITILNNGSPINVTGTNFTNGEIIIMINDAKKAAVGEVNASLSTGRGSTANALGTGYKTERKI